MELSGNVFERTVTVGNNTGREFTGLHGDGKLNVFGYGNVENWPGGGNNGITTGKGVGFRGGAWIFNELALRVSDRLDAAESDTDRIYGLGFRAVRSLSTTTGN